MPRCAAYLTVLFEADAFGGQLINLYPSKPVINFPGEPELASAELAHRLVDQAEHFGAELAEYEGVEHVGRADGHFTLRSDSREVQAGSLILALGLGPLHATQVGPGERGALPRSRSDLPPAQVRAGLRCQRGRRGRR